MGASSVAAPVWHYQRPTLSKGQLGGLFCPTRYGLVEGSTKSGKSAGAMVWLSEHTMPLRAGESTWWVSPVRGQAKIIYERLQRALPRGAYRRNDSELRLTLANDASVWFKGAERPDLLYGDDVYAAVIDEASRMKEAAWHAVRSTLTATRGPIRIIGNVKGRKNWFYRLARKAEGGERDMHYAKLTWRDAVAAGILDKAEILDAKAVLPEAVYRELYEAEASDDQGNPFGLDNIRACIVSGLSPRPPVVWGWDLAKSEDWTVGIALDSRGVVCRLVRWQKPWLECIADIQALTLDTPALIDATGVGDPILETLQRQTRTTKNAKDEDEEADALGNFEGLKFTSASKQRLMESLAAAIKQRRIKYPEGVITTELEAFEYEYTRTGVRYTAPSGMHDDCVTALALAQLRGGSVHHHEGDEWARILKLMDRGHVAERDVDLGLRVFEDEVAGDERERF